MANFNIKLKDVEPNKDGQVKFSFSNNIASSPESWLSEMFETEMISAEIKRGKTRTSITIHTRNQERIDAIRKAAIKLFASSLNVNHSDN